MDVCRIAAKPNLVMPRMIWKHFAVLVGIVTCVRIIYVQTSFGEHPAHFFPEYECTRSSRLCDCVRPRHDHAGFPPKLLVRDAARQCDHSDKPQVIAEIDPENWLASVANLGAYDCQHSRCLLRKSATSKANNVLSAEADAYITATPSEHSRTRSPLRRTPQHLILLTTESTRRYPRYADSDWLFINNFTDVIALSPVTDFPSLPLSYANMDYEHLLTPAYPSALKIDGVAVFIGNCDSQTNSDRLNIVRAINESGVPVYSFGRCLQTHRVEDLFPECLKQTWKWVNFVKLCVLRRFKFTAAFENDVKTGYVTEKILQAFMAGSVPIYVGADDVDRYLPAKDAAIILNHPIQEEVARMIKEVKYLLQNDEAYDHLLAWKKMQPSQLPPSLRLMMKFSYSRLACMICDDVVNRTH